jgi:LysM repeat protein
MIVRDLLPASPQVAGTEAKTAKTAKTQVAKATAPEFETTEVAAPQFSNRAASVEAQRSISGIENEINSAVNEDWRARFARVGTPDLAERPDSNHLTLPQEAARSVDGSPLWSDNHASDTSRLSALAPLKVEMTGGALKGRSSTPHLIARADASPNEASGPQISTKTSTPQTKISARKALSAQLDALKTARAGNTATPAPARVAALPRPTQGDTRGAINAITVSPLEVNVSNALPAFHVAARSSDLRAVAARYGLPVEVLAANNGWDAGKTLVAGERIKLPKQLKVAYRGVPVQGDAPSMLVGGTGVTAFRFLFEQAGGTLKWDAKKQRVVARKGQSEVVLSIGSNQAKVGDKDVMLELAAFLFEGRTMVPLRFFEEGLKAEVEWDPQTGRLVVAMAG